MYAADGPDCGTADPLILTIFIIRNFHWLCGNSHQPQRWPKLMDFSVPYRPFIYGTKTKTQCQLRILFEEGYKSARA